MLNCIKIIREHAKVRKITREHVSREILSLAAFRQHTALSYGPCLDLIEVGFYSICEFWSRHWVLELSLPPTAMIGHRFGGIGPLQRR